MYAKSEDQALTNANLRKHNGTKTRKKNREEGNGRPPKEEQETQAEEKWEDNIRNEIGKENNRKKYRTKSRRRTGRARFWSWRKVFPIFLISA